MISSFLKLMESNKNLNFTDGHCDGHCDGHWTGTGRALSGHWSGLGRNLAGDKRRVRSGPGLAAWQTPNIET